MKSGIDIGFVLFSLVILYDGTFRGFINCIKDQIGFWLPVPDPRSFSPEIGATEPLKKSPGPAETMGSLALTGSIIGTKGLNVHTWSKVG